MGYAIWTEWIKELLEDIDGLNVYDYSTDKVSYPAVIIRAADSTPSIDQETNQTIFRNYEITVQLIVAANAELKNMSAVNKVFLEKLDEIIETFDAKENRHPNDAQATRQRLTRVVPRDSITPEAKRTADIVLTFYKRNG